MTRQTAAPLLKFQFTLRLQTVLLMDLCANHPMLF
jgi:hypothetical protein